MKKITFIVEKTNTGFCAGAEDFDKYPAATTGKDITTLKKNIKYALDALCEYDGVPLIPESAIRVKLDLQQFFEFYGINAKYLAKKIGMNPTLLSQYVNGVKKPSDKQVKKILEGIKALGRELLQLDLI